MKTDEKFNEADLRHLLLPYQCKEHTIEVDHVIDCIFDKELQDKWVHRVGDLMVGCTGNIFVISGKHDLVEEMGGTVFLFGGQLCTSDGSCLLDSTSCYVMNKDGLKYRATGDGYVGEYSFNYSSFKEFRWIPRPMFLSMGKRIF